MKYLTDLTNKQWKMIKDFCVVRKGKNLQKHSKRSLVNAVVYVIKTGCQWRLIPNDFPPYPTVWSFYRRAAKSGLWEKVMQKIVRKTRKKAGRSSDPSYGLIDSQSVKTCYNLENRGIYGGKKDKRPQTSYFD
ncbi:MAG: transposase [Oscillospiraceae bacterium]|nr:transposase [Oscillospiraceae bacterium]